MALSLEQFIQERPRLENFRVKLKPLLEELLTANGINFHVVESRTKSPESYSEKIKNPTKGYSDPKKLIQDVVGCRVIVYYHDDVIKVSDLVKSEFHIVEEELSHQQHSIDADRFGYLSAHYVVKMSEPRKSLGEWEKYSSCYAEIQIRTVVQHAWSAVSHALQYKNESGVPLQLKRKLYRIAGLFELADEEFVGIRNQRAELDDLANKSVASGEKKIPINSSTIAAFLGEWTLKNNIEEKLVEAKFYPEDDSQDLNYLSEVYDLATRCGLKYVEELEDRLISIHFHF